MRCAGHTASAPQGQEGQSPRSWHLEGPKTSGVQYISYKVGIYVLCAPMADILSDPREILLTCVSELQSHAKLCHQGWNHDGAFSGPQQHCTCTCTETYLCLGNQDPTCKYITPQYLLEKMMECAVERGAQVKMDCTGSHQIIRGYCKSTKRKASNKIFANSLF